MQDESILTRQFEKKTRVMSSDISWQEISGENNWKGLLDPLNIDLRRFIIHCGERTHAVGDAFNGEKASEWYGFSRYAPKNFFYNVGLQNGNPYNYTVASFFYARSKVKIPPFIDLEESAWIGYVAVATDEGKAVLGRRDILICWRGTELTLEWVEDLEFTLESASDLFGEANDPKVHYGFKSIYTTSDSESTYNKSSAREQVLREVRILVDQYKDEEISITVAGHSLGAALATLNATDIVANGYNKPTDQPDNPCLVTAIGIASPRVGDQGFLNVFNGLSNLHLLRVKNAGDVVPDVPPKSFGYVDVGEELDIDTTKSPYLKSDTHSELYLHNLELYLHGVAGTQGTEDFKLAVDRDISLVNKGLDALLDKYHVPAEWWIEKNKNMVQGDDGSWKLNDYVPDPPSA